MKTEPLTPPALDYVVKRCLAKDPEQRLQTAWNLLSQNDSDRHRRINRRVELTVSGEVIGTALVESPGGTLIRLVQNPERAIVAYDLSTTCGDHS